jgi:EAL domain-containing protein (putative c-di-GMP-specific phosphodiesterase class I)
VDHSDRLPESRRLARNGAVARTHRHQRVPAPIPGRCSHIDDALRETKLPPESIELEITENSTLNYGDAAEHLQKLHDRRVRIAFDDFGTGYASLSYLTRFPLSRIKIDRSFVRKIIDGTDAAAIVRSLIVMAHNLGLEVIAEGVETQAQVDLA